ncbi:MAG: helix-turn-helix transcriptional regulator, partial [Nocardioidaceae bacterium]|nr:helix-turn-helix transcriptional regulator [Nocardioidaceae bacterium]
MSELSPHQADLLRAADPVVLGARLRAAREARGWTQTAVADGDISIGYLSRIERGERRPTLKVVATLTRRMGIEVQALLIDDRPRVEEEVRLGLDYAELSLESGQALEAESQSRAHLDRATEIGS